MTTLRLYWHEYDYFPYEKNLALREVNAVLDPAATDEVSDGVIARDCRRPERAAELVYFRAWATEDGETVGPTRQRVLEATAERSARRQPTRYSTHGLHEYKGKFNPQTAQALLNLSGLRDGEAVLDPYCGSGTTLIEAMQRGCVGLGVDANPMAVFLANAKAQALLTPSDQVQNEIANIVAVANGLKAEFPDTERLQYLRSWLPPETLSIVERLHVAVGDESSAGSVVLQLLVSDLLRDYSLQEPQDLRVRRRKSPLPSKPLLAELADRVQAFTDRLKLAQEALGDRSGEVRTATANVSMLDRRPTEFGDAEIGTVITSPPYAMALPYIDTQRISLVWLGLAKPKDLRALEAQLTGSREIGTRERVSWNAQVQENSSRLPSEQHRLCVEMAHALDAQDGFRRTSVPALLYRYFDQTAGMFRAVRSLVREDVPFFLVVGHNRTTLGGKAFNIDTPSHLASLGSANGWALQEIIPLQAYRRFGLHARNAVAAESLIHLTAK